MEDSAKGLEVAIGVLVTCFVLGIAFLVSRLASDAQMRSNETMLEMYGGRQGTSGWQSYSGRLVQGDAVLYLVENYDAFFRVATKKKPEGFVSFERSRDKNADTYISQTAEFVCSEVWNSDDNLVGLCITETGTGGVDSVEASGLASYYDTVAEAAEIAAGSLAATVEANQTNFNGQSVAELADDSYKTSYREYVYYTSLQAVLANVTGGGG